VIGFVSVLLSPRFAVTNDLHDSYLSPGGRARNPTDLVRRLTVILTALTIAAFQTRAGILDWLFDAVNKDDIARREAQFLVMDGVSHPSSARFEKVNLVDKDGPFYLFHVVLTTPGGRVDRYRKSYLVCFKLTERATEFRILTVIQDASDPPTENEVAINKRLNRWPVSPPLKAGDDLPPYSSQ
jgi:hypothetical protein